MHVVVVFAKLVLNNVLQHQLQLIVKMVIILSQQHLHAINVEVNKHFVHQEQL